VDHHKSKVNPRKGVNTLIHPINKKKNKNKTPQPLRLNLCVWMLPRVYSFYTFFRRKTHFRLVFFSLIPHPCTLHTHTHANSYTGVWGWYFAHTGRRLPSPKLFDNYINYLNYFWTREGRHFNYKCIGKNRRCSSYV